LLEKRECSLCARGGAARHLSTVVEDRVVKGPGLEDSVSRGSSGSSQLRVCVGRPCDALQLVALNSNDSETAGVIARGGVVDGAVRVAHAGCLRREVDCPGVGSLHDKVARAAGVFVTGADVKAPVALGSGAGSGCLLKGPENVRACAFGDRGSRHGGEKKSEDEADNMHVGDLDLLCLFRLRACLTG